VAEEHAVTEQAIRDLEETLQESKGLVKEALLGALVKGVGWLGKKLISPAMTGIASGSGKAALGGVLDSAGRVLALSSVPSVVRSAGQKARAASLGHQPQVLKNLSAGQVPE
jgi:hypothetical protein